MSESCKPYAAEPVSVAPPLVTEVCAELPLAPPPLEELHRYLGYRQRAVPSARIVPRIEQVTRSAYLYLKPRGTFALYAVTGRTPDSLTFANTRISGKIAGFLAAADRLAVYVATIGDGLSELATEARQSGDTLTEWILDAFGSWATEAAADALMERIRDNAAEGDALTLRYSPGYCGMAMEQQRILFQMVQAEAIGVKLLPSMLMYPLKSVSGIVGLGPRNKLSTYRAPCDCCDRVDCHMRR